MNTDYTMTPNPAGKQRLSPNPPIAAGVSPSSDALEGEGRVATLLENGDSVSQDGTAGRAGFDRWLQQEQAEVNATPINTTQRNTAQQSGEWAMRSGNRDRMQVVSLSPSQSIRGDLPLSDEPSVHRLMTHTAQWLNDQSRSLSARSLPSHLPSVSLSQNASPSIASERVGGAGRADIPSSTLESLNPSLSVRSIRSNHHRLVAMAERFSQARGAQPHSEQAMQASSQGMAATERAAPFHTLTSGALPLSEPSIPSLLANSVNGSSLTLFTQQVLGKAATHTQIYVGLQDAQVGKTEVYLKQGAAPSPIHEGETGHSNAATQDEGRGHWALTIKTQALHWQEHLTQHVEDLRQQLENELDTTVSIDVFSEADTGNPHLEPHSRAKRSAAASEDSPSLEDGRDGRRRADSVLSVRV